MTRLPRRTVPALVTGLILLATSVLVGVSCVQVIAGAPPLLPFDALHEAATSATMADPPVLAAGGLLSLLGVVLLACALLPGVPQVLPLAAHDGGATAGVSRHGLGRDLAGCVLRTDGITAARVKVGVRTVRVKARTPLRDRSGLADRIVTAVTSRLADIELARTPDVRVRVASDRSSR